VCEVRPGLGEGLFGEPALRHVLDRADIFQSTVPVPGRVSNQVHVLDRVVGHLQPVLVLEVAIPGLHPVDHFAQQVRILRMESRTDPFQRYRYIMVELINAIDLF